MGTIEASLSPPTDVLRVEIDVGFPAATDSRIEVTETEGIASCEDSVVGFRIEVSACVRSEPGADAEVSPLKGSEDNGTNGLTTAVEDAWLRSSEDGETTEESARIVDTAFDPP